MTIHFNKRKIETICILISFLLVLFLTATLILAIADGIFLWDILPDNIEKIAVLIMSGSGIIFIAAFLISLMINLSLISSNIEIISEKLNKEAGNDG